MAEKSVIAGLLIFMSTLSSLAQVSFGVKAGVSINYLAVKDMPSSMTYSKSAPGYYLGSYAQINLAKKLYFIPELQLLHHSMKDSVATRTTHLELPLPVSYRPVDLLNIDFGPDYRYEISTNELYKNSKPFDFGLTTGFRLNFIEKFSLIGRYYYGFISIATVTYSYAIN